jgi:predicted transcriptional regulator
MDTSILLSKDYINETVNNYQKILCQVDEIIEQTGYKGKLIAKKMGIPESTFYQKKRKKSFTIKEIKQLVELMEDDDDDFEDEYLLKICKERENDEVIHDIFNTILK